MHSFKHAERQQKVLDTRLAKAQSEIAELNRRGRGRKVLAGDEGSAVVDKILAKHRVAGILTPSCQTESRTVHKRAYRDRPARTIEERETTIHTEIDPLAYQNAVRCLGWRVYVSNDSRLSLDEAVLAYREEYLIERGFGRYKGKGLGLTPLYLSSDARIKGLVRFEYRPARSVPVGVQCAQGARRAGRKTRRHLPGESQTCDDPSYRRDDAESF